MALCAGLALLGGLASATAQGPGQPRAESPERTDWAIASLLFKVESQIAGGRAVAPENDNALDTWQRILVAGQASRSAPGTLEAIARFEAQARRRADDEAAAGRMTVASDFAVFAELAKGLLAQAAAEAGRAVALSQTTMRASPRADVTTDVAVAGVKPTATPPTATPPHATPPHATPIAGTPVAGTPIAANPLGAPPSGATLPQGDKPGPASASLAPSPAPQLSANVIIEAAKPPPVIPAADPVIVLAEAKPDRPTAAANDATTAIARPPALAATKAPMPQDESMATLYIGRGDKMLAIKDISAARRFYEFAADAGSARAALKLARTYDPAFLNEMAVIGLRPDMALSEAWYRMAAALGDRDAEVRLQTLTRNAAH